MIYLQGLQVSCAQQGNDNSARQGRNIPQVFDHLISRIFWHVTATILL